MKAIEAFPVSEEEAKDIDELRGTFTNDADLRAALEDYFHVYDDQASMDAQEFNTCFANFIDSNRKIVKSSHTVRARYYNNEIPVIECKVDGEIIYSGDFDSIEEAREASSSLSDYINDNLDENAPEKDSVYKCCTEWDKQYHSENGINSSLDQNEQQKFKEELIRAGYTEEEADQILQQAEQQEQNQQTTGISGEAPVVSSKNFNNEDIIGYDKSGYTKIVTEKHGKNQYYVVYHDGHDLDARKVDSEGADDWLDSQIKKYAIITNSRKTIKSSWDPNWTRGFFLGWGITDDYEGYAFWQDGEPIFMLSDDSKFDVVDQNDDTRLFKIHSGDEEIAQLFEDFVGIPKNQTFRRGLTFKTRMPTSTRPNIISWEFSDLVANSRKVVKSGKNGKKKLRERIHDKLYSLGHDIPDEEFKALTEGTPVEDHSHTTRQEELDKLLGVKSRYYPGLETVFDTNYFDEFAQNHKDDKYFEDFSKHFEMFKNDKGEYFVGPQYRGLQDWDERFKNYVDTREEVNPIKSSSDRAGQIELKKIIGNKNIYSFDYYKGIDDWMVTLNTTDESEAEEIRSKVSDKMGVSNSMGASYDDLQGMQNMHLGLSQAYEVLEDNYDDLDPDYRDLYVLYCEPAKRYRTRRSYGE